MLLICNLNTHEYLLAQQLLIYLHLFTSFTAVSVLHKENIYRLISTAALLFPYNQSSMLWLYFWSSIIYPFWAKMTFQIKNYILESRMYCSGRAQVLQEVQGFIHIHCQPWDEGAKVLTISTYTISSVASTWKQGLMIKWEGPAAKRSRVHRLCPLTKGSCTGGSADRVPGCLWQDFIMIYMEQFWGL